MRYLIIILLFASCNPTKQASKFLTKAFKKDRVLVAKVARDSFPCTELLRTDTALVVIDSVVYIDCPQDYHVADSGKMVYDTMKSQIVTTKYIKVPVHIQFQTRFINHFWEDSSKIVIAYKEVDGIKNELAKAQKNNSIKKTIIWSLLAVIIAAGLFIFLLIKRKI